MSHDHAKQSMAIIAVRMNKLRRRNCGRGIVRHPSYHGCSTLGLNRVACALISARQRSALTPPNQQATASVIQSKVLNRNCGRASRMAAILPPADLAGPARSRALALLFLAGQGVVFEQLTVPDIRTRSGRFSRFAKNAVSWRRWLRNKAGHRVLSQSVVVRWRWAVVGRVSRTFCLGCTAV